MNINRFSPFARFNRPGLPGDSGNIWPPGWQALSSQFTLQAQQEYFALDPAGAAFCSNVSQTLFGQAPTSADIAQLETLIQIQTPSQYSTLNQSIVTLIFYNCMAVAFTGDSAQWTQVNTWWNSLSPAYQFAFAYGWDTQQAVANTSSFSSMFPASSLYTALQKAAGASGGGGGKKGGGGNHNHHTNPPPPPHNDMPVIVGVALVGVLGLFFYYHYHT